MKFLDKITVILGKKYTSSFVNDSSTRISILQYLAEKVTNVNIGKIDGLRD